MSRRSAIQGRRRFHQVKTEGAQGEDTRKDVCLEGFYLRENTHAHESKASEKSWKESGRLRAQKSWQQSGRLLVIPVTEREWKVTDDPSNRDDPSDDPSDREREWKVTGIITSTCHELIKGLS